LKDDLKTALEGAEISEESHYASHGYAQSVARNDTLKNVTFIIIVFSSFWIAVDTDFNKPDASPMLMRLFSFVDETTCLFFSFEISVRLMAFSNPWAAFKMASFNFDIFLVVLMAMDTWVLPLLNVTLPSAGCLRILRLFRILRLARLGRLVSSVPDLMLLVRGMRMAFRAVISTFFLLLIVIFIFAIFFTQMLSDNDSLERGCFETV
jgi:hypothetical protein